MSLIGLMTASTGEWERGCAMVARAAEMNPNHPGHYYFAPATQAYRDGDYEASLEAILRCNMPNYFFAAGMRAAALGKLGRTEAGHKAVAELLALRPNFPATVRHDFGKWHGDELVEDIVDGLRKAGLEVPDKDGKPVSTSQANPAASNSGAVRVADEGFWVAVLPFKYTGTNADLAALAEGLTDDIVTGMSHFPYLKVVARSSTARFAADSSGAHVAVQDAGKQLGARYIIEGNLRLAGTTLRLAVQLVDTASGAHIWAETYQRAFTPETVFDLQDDLVPRIVSTIADAHGVLPHTMSEALRDKKPEEMSPLEAVFAGFRWSERATLKEYLTARVATERAVQIAPGYSYGWAMLSLLLTSEFRSPNRQPDSLDRALQAARKAVELDATNHRAYEGLALAHFYRKELPAFRLAAERAIALNLMDCCCIADMGGQIAYSGDWERGIAYVKRALELNPVHPGWLWFPLFMDAYRKGQYSEALEYGLKVNMPGFAPTHMALAAVYGQLAMREAASNALQELQKLIPGVAQFARPMLALTYQDELVEQLVDGLRKAGLDVV
jgi:TolB-like protein